MALASGTRLGPFEVIAPLGAGGPASVRGKSLRRELRRGLAAAKRVVLRGSGHRSARPTSSTSRTRDTRLDRTVAIKVLASDLASDAEFGQRFRAEARAISQLTHPHIGTLHDIGEHAGTTVLVMELLVGETRRSGWLAGRSSSDRPPERRAQALRLDYRSPRAALRRTSATIL